MIRVEGVCGQGFAAGTMKPRVRTPVSVVLVTVTFLVLPCLFFYYNPSTSCGIACLISRNNRDNPNNLSDLVAGPVAESPLSLSPELSLNETNLATNSDVASETSLATSSDVASETNLAPSLDAASETSLATSSDVASETNLAPSLDAASETSLATSSDVASETNLAPSLDAASETSLATSSDVASETNHLAPSLDAASETSLDAVRDDASSEVVELEAMLRGAATRDKTVIITTLNEAWATPGTMIDVFLESFRKGEGTERLLEHVVVVALDQVSFQRCRELQHRHCFMLRTQGVDFSGSKKFMSTDFLKMMWRRMSLLRSVLELGYNFVFTDADILWFRNPFEHFVEKADFQISLDKNPTRARSRAKPNCGFQYARSNNRTIAMYQHWCHAGDEAPHVDEQTVLTRMLHSNAFAPSKVQIRFLPTERFSGFCEKSQNMSRVVTMHANCCTSLDNKVHDLKKALRVWEAAKSRSFAVNSTSGVNSTSEVDLWHVPAACLHSKWPRSSPPPPILKGIAT